MCSRRLLTLGTIGGAFVVLAGCNTAHKTIGQDDPLLGEAVRYNAALQTINPVSRRSAHARCTKPALHPTS